MNREQITHVCEECEWHGATVQPDPYAVEREDGVQEVRWLCLDCAQSLGLV